MVLHRSTSRSLLDRKGSHDDTGNAWCVFDSVEDLESCLRENRNQHLIYYPRCKHELIESQAESISRALESNDTLLTLSIEEVRIPSQLALHRLAHAVFSHSMCQKITFYDNKLGDEGVALLMQAVYMKSPRMWPSLPSPEPFSHHQTNIKSIVLSSNNIGDMSCCWISQAIMQNSNIRELDLSYNEITSAGCSYLAYMLAHSGLTSLVLNGNQVGVLGARALAQALCVNQQVSVLGLCGNGLHDEGAIEICKAVEGHSSMRALLLEDNNLQERGLAAIGHAYRRNPRIGMMEISWNSVSTFAMSSISCSLDNVLYLYLDHCDLRDQHITILARSLRTNTSVKDLFLEQNSIGYQGAMALAETLQVNRTLEGVLLDRNPLTEQGAHVLLEAVKRHNCTLRRLQFRDEYHHIQRECDVYLDMNEVGREAVLSDNFQLSLWPSFLQKAVIAHDPDLIYLFLREKPELFQEHQAMPI